MKCDDVDLFVISQISVSPHSAIYASKNIASISRSLYAVSIDADTIQRSIDKCLRLELLRVVGVEEVSEVIDRLRGVRCLRTHLLPHVGDLDLAERGGRLWQEKQAQLGQTDHAESRIIQCNACSRVRRAKQCVASPICLNNCLSNVIGMAAYQDCRVSRITTTSDVGPWRRKWWEYYPHGCLVDYALFSYTPFLDGGNSSQIADLIRQRLIGPRSYGVVDPRPPLEVMDRFRGLDGSVMPPELWLALARVVHPWSRLSDFGGDVSGRVRVDFELTGEVDSGAAQRLCLERGWLQFRGSNSLFAIQDVLSAKPGRGPLDGIEELEQGRIELSPVGAELYDRSQAELRALGWEIYPVVVEPGSAWLEIEPVSYEWVMNVVTVHGAMPVAAANLYHAG